MAGFNEVGPAGKSQSTDHAARLLLRTLLAMVRPLDRIISHAENDFSPNECSRKAFVDDVLDLVLTPAESKLALLMATEPMSDELDQVLCRLGDLCQRIYDGLQAQVADAQISPRTAITENLVRLLREGRDSLTALIDDAKDNCGGVAVPRRRGV